MFPLYEKNAAIAGAPGQFMTLDSAARRMFYTRTKKTCPQCGQSGRHGGGGTENQAELCPECGQPLPQQSPPTPQPPAPSAQRPAFDDLDALVDQLDRTMQRRR